VIGTEFEALEYAEPQLVPGARTANPKRVLVLGAGVSGIEAARVLAGRGHTVEVWEKAARTGGQMHLAIAAPDKLEVEPVWSYRWQEVAALGVPVKTGVAATADSIRARGFDCAIVATGARARPAPFDTSRLSPKVTVAHAWDVLAAPERVSAGSAVTIVGGGMVGMETADLLSLRDARCTVVEALSAVAPGMARNNRIELIERVTARGTRIMTGAGVIDAEGTHLDLEGADGATTRLEIGEWLITAIGPAPDQEGARMCEAAGVPYVIVGDAYKPGDFLTCLRDASLAALSVDNRFR
jgi:pyruvate/2-oxoglutarate dehydrogenase complex dihydrolipoamide dehydrogenase (E3) component